MINKIKEYFEYRKNKKIAKREFVKMAATALPVIREASNKGTGIVKFIIKLAEATKYVKNEKLIEMVLSEVSHVLQIDNTRIIEILTYITNLSPQDIQKILIDSIVETMPKEDVNE